MAGIVVGIVVVGAAVGTGKTLAVEGIGMGNSVEGNKVAVGHIELAVGIVVLVVRQEVFSSLPAFLSGRRRADGEALDVVHVAGWLGHGHSDDPFGYGGRV